MKNGQPVVRQLWLRTRERPVMEFDPRPLEEAVLESDTDTFMELVRAQVRRMQADFEEDKREDESFVDDELVPHQDFILSPHEDSHPLMEAVADAVYANYVPEEEIDPRDAGQGDVSSVDLRDTVLTDTEQERKPAGDGSTTE